LTLKKQKQWLCLIQMRKSCIDTEWSLFPANKIMAIMVNVLLRKCLKI
jgi:hypothetical protein